MLIFGVLLVASALVLCEASVDCTSESKVGEGYVCNTPIDVECPTGIFMLAGTDGMQSDLMSCNGGGACKKPYTSTSACVRFYYCCFAGERMGMGSPYSFERGTTRGNIVFVNYQPRPEDMALAKKISCKVSHETEVTSLTLAIIDYTPTDPETGYCFDLDNINYCFGKKNGVFINFASWKPTGQKDYTFTMKLNEEYPNIVPEVGFAVHFANLPYTWGTPQRINCTIDDYGKRPQVNQAIALMPLTFMSYVLALAVFCCIVGKVQMNA